METHGNDEDGSFGDHEKYEEYEQFWKKLKKLKKNFNVFDKKVWTNLAKNI